VKNKCLRIISGGGAGESRQEKGDTQRREILKDGPKKKHRVTGRVRKERKQKTGKGKKKRGCSSGYQISREKKNPGGEKEWRGKGGG